MDKKKVIIRVSLLIAIIVAINLLASEWFFRIDFTADKRYTLSSSTKDVLSELEDVIFVKAYFTEELPPQFRTMREDFENMLKEYETEANGNIYYEFINPNESEQLEQEAQQNGIAPVMVNVQGRDQVQQMRAYLGVILELGENQKEIIPFVQGGPELEYNLTTSIKKLSIADKPVIGFLQGHGEPEMNANAQVVQELSILYDVVPHTITDTTEIPSSFNTLVVVNPTDTFPASHLQQIDDYLGKGGAAYITYAHVEENINARMLGTRPNIGITTWLQNKGVAFKDSFAIDAVCGAVTVPQQLGNFVVNAQVNLPLIPLISTFAEHPVTQGLDQIVLPLTAPLNLENKKEGINYTALLQTSAQSGVLPTPAFIDLEKQWAESDFQNPGQVLAVALEGNFAGNEQGKMVVVSNGSFAVNQGQQQVNEDNVNFAVNAIDWLADDTGLIALRTKGVTARPIEPVEETTIELIRYVNVVLPVLAILLIGFYRKRKNAQLRKAWMEGKY